MANTTAEEIAAWIGEQFAPIIGQKSSSPISKLQIEVEENFGQWAICEMPFD